MNIVSSSKSTARLSNASCSSRDIGDGSGTGVFSCVKGSPALRTVGESKDEVFMANMWGNEIEAPPVMEGAVDGMKVMVRW